MPGLPIHPAPTLPHRSSAWLVCLLAFAMALAFQGSRGLWDPDEGRYSNVALEMVDGGDYLVPHRHHESMHVTKPPLTYWAMAASVNLFGRSEWALRLPMALGLALTVALVFALGRAFVPQRPWLPALVYLSSPLPFLAASAITTDTLLTFAETAAMLAYVRFRFAGGSPRWLDGMWALFGLAFMVKGPPALLPLLAIAAWEFRQRSTAVARRPLGLLAFVAIGLSWFIWIVQRHPELLPYFLGHEVLDRVASGEHDRHGEWYGGLVIYLPTLALGALPWAALALWRRWLSPTAAPMPASSRFLWCWVALPLAVFFLARSRLPFYLLPLFVPLSLLIAQSLADLADSRARRGLVLGWLGLLLATKLLIAHAPSDQDARRFAGRLRPLLPAAPRELVFVEAKARYGLHFYLGAEVEKISLAELAPGQPPSDAPYDDDLDSELYEAESPRYFLVPLARVAAFEAQARSRRLQPRRLGRLDRLDVYELLPRPPADASAP